MSIQDGIIFIAQPPPGVKSNAVNPPSLELLSFVLFSVLMGFNVFFVFCRLSFKATSGFSLDDLFIFLAAILGNAQTALNITLTKYARHGWDIPLTWFDESYIKRYAYAQTMLGYSSVLLAKISILLLYLRIFTVKKEVRYMVYGGIIWSIITYGPFFITTTWYCAPHKGENWGLPVLMRCSGFADWQIFVSVMAVILDLFILILPLPLLRRLQLSRNKKIGLMVVFSTASLAVVCCILTLVYRIKLRKPTDSLYTTWQSTITNLVENNVAIIVACVPGTSSFFKRYIAPSRLSTFLTSSLRSLVPKKGSSSNASATPRSPLSPLSPGSKKSWNEGHIGLASIGGTPFRNGGTGAMGSPVGSPGFNPHEYKELKDGSMQKTTTEVMGAVRYKDGDGRRRDDRNEEEQGIVKNVVFSQRSYYGG